MKLAIILAVALIFGFVDLIRDLLQGAKVMEFPSARTLLPIVVGTHMGMEILRVEELVVLTYLFSFLL